MQSNEVQRNACALRLKACQRLAAGTYTIESHILLSFTLSNGLAKARRRR